ncbi:hypothetical protein LEP1GSC178_2178 [Leptospira licerasiae str. MMD4847]|uniref:Uncharacterized protein n=1 Tax=Leptospira licerasiae str. MMD4847 TaxID=1049971 RepID=A0ABN0HEB4_9LEPT|nr:hypothetical protein LEP1GSC178_2178 [Leptospira licerasiae str. MMD4847]
MRALNPKSMLQGIRYGFFYKCFLFKIQNIKLAHSGDEVLF